LLVNGSAVGRDVIAMAAHAHAAMRASIASLLLVLPLSACGGKAKDSVDDAGAAVDQETGLTEEDAVIPPVDGPPPTTDPITTPEDTWSWVPVTGTRCANGSETGIGANLTKRSKKALVFMMGGGACWDATSCGFGLAANLDGYSEGKFKSEIGRYGSTGVFDRADAENPFKDYSFFFVPYCTGDVHAGDKVSVYGGKTYYHHGYVNMTYNFGRIVPTLKGAGVDYAVISGSSAGGFGALWNFARFQDALGDSVHVDVVDDGGPPLRPTYMPTSLQESWNTAWGLDTTVPAGCTKCTAKDGYYNAVEFLTAKYPGHRASLISSYQDSVIRGYFGISGPKMEEGLKDFADAVLPSAPDWRVYYVTGSKHVFLGEKLSSIVSGGVKLSDFLSKQVNQDASWASVRP
jgi:hypothetical protein